MDMLMFFAAVFVTVFLFVYLGRLAARGNQHARDARAAGLWGAGTVATLWALRGMVWLFLAVAWGYLWYLFAHYLIRNVSETAYLVIGFLNGLLFLGWVAAGRR